MADWLNVYIARNTLLATLASGTFSANLPHWLCFKRSSVRLLCQISSKAFSPIIPFVWLILYPCVSFHGRKEILGLQIRPWKYSVVFVKDALHFMCGGFHTTVHSLGKGASIGVAYQCTWQRESFWSFQSFCRHLRYTRLLHPWTLRWCILPHLLVFHPLWMTVEMKCNL